MPTPLEHFKHREFDGVKNLADAAERVLKSLGPGQDKKTVTEFPNERTIRYYLTEGLLPQPREKRGLKSIFGYEHLLTLLVIKKLQADGVPISLIKKLILGKSVGELEALLDEEIHIFTEQQALDDYRQATGHTDDSDVVVSHDPNARREYLESQQRSEKNEAQSYLESLLLNKPPRPRNEDMDVSFSRPLFSASAPPPPPAAAPKPAEPSAESWKRYTIAPGVEIHIERNYKPPRDERERSRIIELIERVLHFRSRK
jgi:DNA-binding transcriptional MerR regulator